MNNSDVIVNIIELMKKDTQQNKKDIQGILYASSIDRTDYTSTEGNTYIVPVGTIEISADTSKPLSDFLHIQLKGNEDWKLPSTDTIYVLWRRMYEQEKGIIKEGQET